MATQPIRVLVVDDSAVIRRMICDHLNEAPGIEVAGYAHDGEDAVRVFEKVQPDVVTLDVQMPKRDGLETLKVLLKIRPVPIIMVSSLTRSGADVTFQAMEHGALDYLAKPEGLAAAERVFHEELPAKIRAVAGENVGRILRIRQQRNTAKILHKTFGVLQPATIAPALKDKCIVIGISTGGPPALAHVFESLAPPMPPIVIVQHMPPKFTASLAGRLNGLSALTVKEAATGDPLQPNHVYLAQGGKHLYLRGRAGNVKCVVKDGDTVSGHKPSVDVMMTCAAEIFGDKCLGVIMTGMGRDGADGCGVIRAAGGYTLGQDGATSDVYGMNKVAFVEGNIDRQFGLNEAAQTISTQARRLWKAGVSV